MSQTWVLFLGDGSWRLCRDTGSGVEELTGVLDSGQDHAGAAVAVKDALGGAVHRDKAVILAVPSQWCLAAPVMTDDLPASAGHKALLFRLEEQLPVAAEEVVAAFVRHDAQALGVALLRSKVEAWIKALEAVDVQFDYIVPEAFLVAHGIAEVYDTAVVQNGDVGDVVMTRDGKPAHWALLPSDPNDIIRHLNAVIPDNRQARTVIVGDESFVAALRQQLSSAQSLELTGTSLALASADAVTAGAGEPWINLRREALAPPDSLRSIRKSLQAAYVGVVICLICLLAAMWIRIGEYRQVAQAQKQQQQVVFRKLFPNMPAPPALHARFVSEEQRLRGQSGAAGDLPTRVSALELLHQTMGKLATGPRLRLQRLLIENGRVQLDGEARSHVDASTLAAALRASQKLDVDDPRTEQVKPDSVAVTLSARRKSDSRKELR